MTIENVKLFGSRLASFLKYFNKPCDDFVQEAWLSECDKHLSDQEFYDGCILTIRKCQFLPPVDDFIKLVKGSSTALTEFETAEAWDIIVQLLGIVSSRSERDQGRISIFGDTAAPAHLYALNKLGGLFKLSQLPEEDLHWKRKEFMEFCQLYEQVEEMRREGSGTPRTLGGGAPQKALSGVTVDAIAFGTQNDKQVETVPAHGFTSVGDALF